MVGLRCGPAGILSIYSIYNQVPLGVQAPGTVLYEYCRTCGLNRQELRPKDAVCSLEAWSRSSPCFQTLVIIRTTPLFTLCTRVSHTALCCAGMILHCSLRSIVILVPSFFPASFPLFVLLGANGRQVKAVSFHYRPASLLRYKFWSRLVSMVVDPKISTLPNCRNPTFLSLRAG